MAQYSGFSRGISLTVFSLAFCLFTLTTLTTLTSFHKMLKRSDILGQGENPLAGVDRDRD